MWRRVRAADAEVMQQRAAAALRERGLRAGDRVAVAADSSPAVLCTMLGALRAGIVPVPLNPALLVDEQAALLADADPALVLRHADVEVLLATTDERAELAAAPLARPMHYTSGTTGRPKGVWSGVLDDVAATALLAEERDLWGFDPADVLLVCSPLHHSAPLRLAAGTLLAGGEVIILDRFDAAVVLDVIAQERPTAMFCVPTHLRRLFAREDHPALTSFRLVAHAGEPCPQPLKLAAIESFPRGSVWEFYGSTEGQFTACSSDEWLERPGTVGRARPNRSLSVDGDGAIWCEVPGYARFEYWRDAARTAAAWRGAAFTVGDLGRLDAEGYLFLDGRRDDLVISGGVNVYPAEVEQAIALIPGVVAAAVFGVDDDRWGQRVCAAVVGAVSPSEVAAHCRDRLAPYKCPKDVFVVPELPTTSAGKLKRSAVASTLGLV